MIKKVLIIEDEPEFAELLQYRLERPGVQLVLATDGLQGLRQARALRPDLVLLDVLLPDVDGLTLCSILRREPATVLTPIILLSAVNTEVTRHCAQVAGADAFFSKPVDFSRLHLAVAQALAGSPRSAEDELSFAAT